VPGVDAPPLSRWERMAALAALALLALLALFLWLFASHGFRCP
jgi:cyanate permease